MKRPASNTTSSKARQSRNDLSYFRFKEREIACPNCHINLILGSPMDTIFFAQRTYPNCEKEFVVMNDEPMAMPEYARQEKAA
jgi:ssDNA-binding Zn-finger/Zn-ribbon topoisomerase 1